MQKPYALLHTPMLGLWLATAAADGRRAASAAACGGRGSAERRGSRGRIAMRHAMCRAMICAVLCYVLYSMHVYPCGTGLAPRH